jgi:hypothetical protein
VSAPLTGKWVQPLRIALVAVLTQVAGSVTIHNAAARYPVVAATIALAELLVAVLPVSVTSEPADPPKPPGAAT